MKDFVPLLQSLVWPLTVGLLLLCNRAAFRRAISALVRRIEEGAPLKAGAVEIGAAPALPAVPKDALSRDLGDLPHDIYIVHTATRARDLDSSEYEYYRLRIFLEADEPSRLDEVASVTYRLHPSFKDPTRTVSDRTAGFQIRTAAWGEFNMTAEITFIGGRRLVVERYINLPGSA